MQLLELDRKSGFGLGLLENKAWTLMFWILLKPAAQWLNRICIVLFTQMHNKLFVLMFSYLQLNQEHHLSELLFM